MLPQPSAVVPAPIAATPTMRSTASRRPIAFSAGACASARASSARTEAAHDAVEAREIAIDADVLEAARAEELRRCDALRRADLEREQPAGDEVLGRLLDDAAHDVEAVGAAVEREPRL